MADKIEESLELLLNVLERRGFRRGRTSLANSPRDLGLFEAFRPGARDDPEMQRRALLGAIVATLDDIYRSVYEASGVVEPSREHTWTEEELHDLKRTFVGATLFNTGLIDEAEMHRQIPEYHQPYVKEKILGFLLGEQVPPEELPRAVYQALRNVQDSILQELNEAAVNDGLTGLYNQRFFRSRLAEELERAHRYAHPIALLLIDLNNLKQINDKYGHKTGDRIIREVAQALRIYLRDTDVVCRIGGDEYAALMPHMSAEDLQEKGPQLMMAVNRQVAQAHPELYRGTEPIEGQEHENPTEQEKIAHAVSIGGAVYPTHARNEGELMSAADMALYLSKMASRKDEMSQADLQRLLRIHGLEETVFQPGCKLYNPALNGISGSFYDGVQELLVEQMRRGGSR